jgi:hypothetical protein
VVALRTRGADVDALDADRRSTLYVLALDNRLPMARLLLRRCAAHVALPDTEVCAHHTHRWNTTCWRVNKLFKYRHLSTRFDKEKASF